MKVLINEKQLKLITEQEGLGDFFAIIAERYPDSVYMLSYLKNFIEKSGCKRIAFEYFNYPAAGVSLVDRLVLNKSILKHYNFKTFLYVLFHETAHQYQFKKHGVEKMNDIYEEKISIEDGAKFIMSLENVADEFAIRKIREVEKRFNDDTSKKLLFSRMPITKQYENVPLEDFKKLIESQIKLIKDAGYTNETDIAEILYNHVKNG
jgi:hypothetical protein